MKMLAFFDAGTLSAVMLRPRSKGEKQIGGDMFPEERVAVEKRAVPFEFTLRNHAIEISTGVSRDATSTSSLVRGGRECTDAHRSHSRCR